MPTLQPPAQAEVAILSPVSELISRVEIYETDGETRWMGGENDDRLIDGSVAIDYTRDERRSVDLLLDNSDFGLEHKPEGFWYNKILKVFKGVRYMDTSAVISQRVRTNLNTNPRGISATGYTSPNGSAWTTAVNQDISGHPLGILKGVKVTVGNASISPGVVASLINVDTLGTSGTSRYCGVWIFSPYDCTAEIYYNSDTSATRGTIDAPANTWVFVKTFSAGSNYANILLTRKDGISATGNYAFITGGICETIPVVGFFDGAVQNFANRFYAWTGAANSSSSTETVTVADYTPRPAVWETQIGEFMIDNITEDHFPYVIKVNGRDYTKRCQLSKFAAATSFAAGTPIADVITAMAQVAGITKFIIPPNDRVLGKDYHFERGVPRWQAMKEIADSFGYELYFDAQGYLVMRQFLDPTTSPVAFSLTTGPTGSLVTYSKSVNDTRIYNHIVVSGEASDSDAIPVSAEALNNNPLSPTRIDELGDRLYTYVSPFITTEQQAQDVANRFLAIHALEEYDLNFAAISLPWLEAGEILEFVDPRPDEGEPTKFLLSSLSLPLGLGPMSGNAKRVIAVS